MDSLRSLLTEILLAMALAGIPTLLAYVIPLIRANIHNARLARIAEGSANAAGRIVLQAVQARARGASESMALLITKGMQAELPVLMSRYAESLAAVATDTTSAETVARDTLAAKIGDRLRVKESP